MSKARSLADLGNVYSDGALSNRNFVINGAMRVAQRGTSVHTTGGGFRTIDRMRYTHNDFSPTLIQSQSTDAPEGFSYSHKMEVDAADTIGGTTEYSVIDYNIEAQDLQSLGYGTSAAQSVTLSFWVKSNVTGTYAVGINQNDASRNISETYTVNSSGVWEYKTVTFAGDASGAINNDNGIGLNIEWPMSTGTAYTGGSNGVWAAEQDNNRWAGHAVSVFETTSNYWQITGVQLEVGDTATPFEHRSYGEELALCQRYYRRDQASNASALTGLGTMHNSTTARMFGTHPTTMRAVPTISYVNFRVSSLAGTMKTVSALGTATSTEYLYSLAFTCASGLSSGSAVFGRVASSTTGYIAFDAEL